jgi:hypothetical protein
MKLLTMLLLILSLNLPLSANSADAEGIPLVCEWVGYRRHNETFILYLEEKRVQWVSGNSDHHPIMIPIYHLDDGLVAFKGTKERVEVRANERKTVTMTFRINRVSGTFKTIIEEEIDGASQRYVIGHEYDTKCVVVDKLF